MSVQGVHVVLRRLRFRDVATAITMLALWQPLSLFLGPVCGP
jgi:hypothetical protein